MTQNTLSTHVQKSQEALTALLKKLLGAEVPVEAASPEPVSGERAAALHDDATEHFCLEDPDHDLLVALDPDWVPVLSEAMFGERLAPDAEGTADLMQEVASQGFGTIQSTLAAEGTKVPSVQFDAVAPGNAPSALGDASWHVSFSVEHEGTSLQGFVLLPSDEESSKEKSSKEESSKEDASEEESPSGNTFAHKTSSESSSAQQEPAPSSSADPESGVDVAPAAFSDLGDEDLSGRDEASTFELLAEVDLEVRVELGRRELPLADVLKLTTGSVVELEKMVGEPLSVYANGRLIAEGEAVVIDEQFGVRITDLASEDTRDKAFF